MVTHFIATHTRSGLEVLATEREVTNAELDAFAEFSDRLTAMEVSSSLDDNHNQRLNVQTTMQSQSDNQLQRVQEAYRETVMDVPYYDEVYNESLLESLAEEFGSEIASALMTNEYLTPPLRNQILIKSRQARNNRANFLDSLSKETENLRSMDKTITEIGTNLDTLNARTLETWTRTDLTESCEQILAAEEQCEELAATRQAILQNSRSPGPTPSDLNFNEYLYESLPVTYPVLSDLANLTNTLKTEQSRVERAIDLCG